MPFFGGNRQKRREQSDVEKMSVFAGYSGDDFDEKYLEILERKRLQAEEERLHEEQRQKEDEYERQIHEAIQLANRGRQKR
ncbi:hypothetical protein [Laceyella putida]|uniref:YfhD family protein n=1 Tax=Laceyella putida TaxID=110101 RepID=A0ABW2RHG4_9BACL